MSNIQDRVDALRARAAPNSGATDAERRTCLMMLERLRETHPTLDFSEPEEESMMQFWWRDDHDAELVIRVSYYLGCTPYYVRKTNASKAKLFQINGPRSLLTIIPECVRYHRKVLDEILEGATLGYVLGALPPKPKADDDDDDNKVKPKPMSPEKLAAARNAMKIGEQHRGRSTFEALPAPKEE